MFTSDFDPNCTDPGSVRAFTAVNVHTDPGSVHFFYTDPGSVCTLTAVNAVGFYTDRG